MEEKKEIVLTLQQIKEQGSVVFDIIKEVRGILDQDISDSEKVSKITAHLGLIFGSMDYTIKKMTDEKKELITDKELTEYSKEYLEKFIEINTKK